MIWWKEKRAADAHLVWNLAAPRAEAADWGAFLLLTYGCSGLEFLIENLWTLLLQLKGQIMENAHTVLQRLDDRTRKEQRRDIS